MVTKLIEPSIPSVYSERESDSGTTIVVMPDGREVVINRYRMWRDIGLTVAHTSKIFTGHRYPSIHAAMKMAQYLKISVEDLYWIITERPKYLSRATRTTRTTRTV